MDAAHCTAGCKSKSRGDCTLPKNVKKLHVEERNSRPHLEMLNPYAGFWGSSDSHPENKLTIGSGSKTAIPKRPRSGAKAGPPRYTVVKWAEILARLLMTSSLSSRQTAVLALEP